MLNKIVNGIEIQCSSKEETEIRAEWATNETLQAAKVIEKEETIKVKQAALSKLTALGFSADEIKALLGVV